jgi:hypothetical protein
MCFWAVEAHKEAGGREERVPDGSQCVVVPRYVVRGKGYLKRYIKAVETMSVGSVGGMVGTLTELNSSLHLLKTDLGKANFGWSELNSLNHNASTQLLSLFTYCTY